MVIRILKLAVMLLFKEKVGEVTVLLIVGNILIQCTKDVHKNIEEGAAPLQLTKQIVATVLNC